jgi:hypothetical protein
VVSVLSWRFWPAIIDARGGYPGAQTTEAIFTSLFGTSDAEGVADGWRFEAPWWAFPFACLA